MLMNFQKVSLLKTIRLSHFLLKCLLEALLYRMFFIGPESDHWLYLSLFHFNLFQGGLCELQSIHTSWSWSWDGFQGVRRLQPGDRVCKVTIFVNNWIHIANGDQWENLRSKLCLVLVYRELAHRWFFEIIFYQILLSGTIHKNINIGYIWTVQV